MKLSKPLPLLAILAMLVLLCSCAGSTTPEEPSSFESGKVTVTFDFEKQSGYASNQFAVWIEDMDGGFVKTLYATRFTASGGYKNRPDSISEWVRKSSLASMKKAEIDAIAGATPKSGSLAYTWDITDAQGNTVPPGAYRFCVEGSLRWKNRVLYSGVIEVGSASDMAEAEAESIYEGSGSQPALTADSPENNMVGKVTAIFAPARAN